MINETQRTDMVLAFETSCNSVIFPEFSDVKIEDGLITVKVTYRACEVEPAAVLEHMLDKSERFQKGLSPFPYKFEGFEDRADLNNFRITIYELESWRDLMIGLKSTGVNLALFGELSRTCKAVTYFKQCHQDELSSVPPPSLQNHNWRYAPA